jgi:hypothetical protein
MLAMRRQLPNYKADKVYKHVQKRFFPALRIKLITPKLQPRDKSIAYKLNLSNQEDPMLQS